MEKSRRSVLQIGAAALAAEAFGATIAKALAQPANVRTGTLRDVEHVVILMQENRSFDHYFGSLRGVRGFGDPRPLTLPSGESVFRQPSPNGTAVAPFHLDTHTTRADHLGSLDHSWKGSHERWKHHDAWIRVKTPMTMGYFTRDDLPFYYALADAFTICDAYHCSIFGPTSPNRNFLFTGTSGLSAGYEGPLAVRNALLELNWTSDPSNDHAMFSPLAWRTYAERLQAAGVSWKVYQEYDNYGDNALAYFAAFRGPHADAALMQRGRSWVEGSTKENAHDSRGEHLVAALAKDVREGTLPQVSWIVAPYIMCEHPAAGPGYGQSLTARLLAAIVDNPEIWSKTVLLLNYDENDGLFDHMPPYLPALGPALGASTASVEGENYGGEPVGLGPRVPMLAISPWSKGGFVNSQVFDHTSVIRFLERRFGVAEPNISPWRRAVCGDLTSAFDFRSPDAAGARLPDTGGYIAAADASRSLPRPVVPPVPGVAPQERGQRPARALPYDFQVQCETDAARKSAALTFANTGAAGAAFNVYAARGTPGPWFFTVEAGKTLRHELLTNVDAYDLTVFGPNGFLRGYRGAPGGALEATAIADPAQRALVVTLRNTGAAPAAASVRMRAYGDRSESLTVPAGQSVRSVWPTQASADWYDIEVTSGADFLRRFAGHIETGAPSMSDPLIGAQTSDTH
ncbi:MAG: phospholipase C, phosphocholine-specific [Proteobacteria bacterium]|nr:phospholipase C, phosphocholine-specific [Pseudomonadota bacterium]